MPDVLIQVILLESNCQPLSSERSDLQCLYDIACCGTVTGCGGPQVHITIIGIGHHPDTLVTVQFVGVVSVLCVMLLDVDTPPLSHLLTKAVDSKHLTLVVSSGARRGYQEEGRR